jgi:hypothetical protein
MGYLNRLDMQSQGFLCGPRHSALGSLGYSLFHNAYAFADFNASHIGHNLETARDFAWPANLDRIGAQHAG